MKLVISGDDLRNMRQYAGKTTKEMANKVKVSRNTYENWEKDVGQPKTMQFFTLCLYCGIDVDSFITQIKNIPSFFQKGAKPNAKQQQR